MFKLALRGVRYNVGRYIATLIAIITGVAFFTATGFLSDRVIDALEGNVAREYGNVGAAVVADDDAGGATFVDELRIGQQPADEIMHAPGVEGSAGELTGTVAFLGDDGKSFARDAVGRLWIDDDELNPLQLKEGAAPEASGQIAVDRGIAKDHDLTVGKAVKILTLAGQFDATVVGITEFGDTDSVDQSGTVSISSADAFDWLSSGIVEYQAIYVRGSGDEAALQAAVEPFVPSGFVAQTGDDFRQDKRDEIGSFGRILKQGLQGFALLALLVGGFVIYNTFNVIVAQRLRELAVMAAVGATPKQIKRSLRFEGIVIGLLGSVLGVAVGFGMTFLLIAILKAAGVELPGSGIKVGPSTVVSGIIAGTLITVFSVRGPARRAARTEPIEALRQAAVDTTRFTKKRIVAAVLLIGLGVLGMLFGSAVAVGFGAFALFIGVILSGPFIAVAGSFILRPLLSRLGLEGRLAADNTARNPKRTATTANALLIGVFLVTFVTVAGTSVKDFAVGKINELSSADYTIKSVGGTIDDQLVADLEGVEGVAQVVPYRTEAVTIDGDPSAISTGDLTQLEGIANLEVKEGSLDALTEGTVAISEDDAKDHPLGSTVTLANADGKTVDLEVAVVLKTSIDLLYIGSIVDAQTFDAFVGDTAPTAAFLDLDIGAQTDTKDAIEDLTDLRPDITLTEGNYLGRLFGSIFDFLIKAVNGLLLMSVVIALIGIVNTLSLSILERRRELGLLRVVGMVDKRVQRMVRLESVLIATLGTVSGMALGAFSGFAMIRAIDRLGDADISLSVPWIMLAIVLVLGVVLGVVAALIPAHRSTRLDVLDAIGAV